MTTRFTDENQGLAHDPPKPVERKSVAAHKVGLSLTVADEVLKEFDAIQAKAIESAEEDQEFSWQ